MRIYVWLLHVCTHVNVLLGRVWIVFSLSGGDILKVSAQLLVSKKYSNVRTILEAVNPLRFVQSHLVEFKVTWRGVGNRCGYMNPLSRENQAKNVLITFPKEDLKLFWKTDDSGMCEAEEPGDPVSPSLLQNGSCYLTLCPPSQPPKGMVRYLLVAQMQHPMIISVKTDRDISSGL